MYLKSRYIYEEYIIELEMTAFFSIQNIMETSVEQTKYLVQRDDIEIDITILKSFLERGKYAEHHGLHIISVPNDHLTIRFAIEFRFLAFIRFTDKLLANNIMKSCSSTYSLSNTRNDDKLQIRFRESPRGIPRMTFNNKFVEGALILRRGQFKKLARDESLSITKEDPSDRKNTSFMFIYPHDDKLIIIFHYAGKLADIVIILPRHKVKKALQNLL